MESNAHSFNLPQRAPQGADACGAFNLLRAVNVPVSYDGLEGFTRDGRRDLFRSVAQRQGYIMVEDNPHFLLISRRPLEKEGVYFLLSAHADSVYRMDEEFVCRTAERDGAECIEATLDNSAGLTAALSMLLNNSLPDNFILALGAEEPPNPLVGAGLVGEHLCNAGIRVKYALALDVTYDNRGNAMAIECNARNTGLVNTLLDDLHEKGLDAFPAKPTRADEAMRYKDFFPAMLLACPVFGEWHGQYNSIERTAFEGFVKAATRTVQLISGLSPELLMEGEPHGRLYGVLTDGKQDEVAALELFTHMDNPSIPGLRSGHEDVTLMFGPGNGAANRKVICRKVGRESWQAA